jgi:hypothetical protein
MRRVLTGAAAGAAGTAALNAVTYLDITLRGRGGSSAPKDLVDHLSDSTDIAVPGAGEARDNRATGVGALLGMATGVGVGSLYGLSRAAGWRPSMPLAAVATGLAAMAGSDVPMAALRVSDPRRWTWSDWLADIVPHLTYGLATAAVYGLAVDDRKRNCSWGRLLGRR